MAPNLSDFFTKGLCFGFFLKNVPIQLSYHSYYWWFRDPKANHLGCFSYPVNATNLKWFTGFLPSLNSGRGYFSAVASGAAWLSGAAKPVVKALRKSLGEHGELYLRRDIFQHQNLCRLDSNFEVSEWWDELYNSKISKPRSYIFQ